MKEHFLSILRDRHTPPSAFREASNQLASLMAAEVAMGVPLHPSLIDTPLAQTQGALLKQRVILVPILRAGLALLPAFQKLFKEAPIGFFGIRRDEVTALPKPYYENIPHCTPKDQIILLDPMLATGGTTIAAIDRLKAKGATRILLVSVVAAPEGVSALKKHHPDVALYTVAVDERLNSNHFIVPGLGDFGDRFFGTIE